MEQPNPMREIIKSTVYYAIFGLLVAHSVDSSRRVVDWAFNKLK